MARARSLAWLAIYALAMGLVEAAIVVHLRHLYYPDDPLAIFPLRLLGKSDLALELARELATVLMLAAVAALAARGPLRVFAAFLFAFGLWDLGYYFWLKVFLGWPVDWLEWDTLFLIPWAWFGPWVAPALVALLFVVWGAGVLGSGRAGPLARGGLVTFVVGAALAMVAFLQPATGAILQGLEGFRGFVPGGFWWAVYWPGLVGMAAGLVWISLRAEGISSSEQGR